MKKDEISHILDRYLSARKEQKDIYFDADQVDELLNSFEEKNDFSLYPEVLALGLKLHPGNTELLIRKGKLLVMNEEYKEALSLIDQIGERANPDLDTLQLECYCMLGNYGKVIELTEKLINEEADYMNVIFEYITPLLNDMEMYKEALDYVGRGLLLFPDNLILKEELCFTLETEGEFERAIAICNELIDKNPYSFEYWFALGRLYSFSAEYDKAIEAFDFALTCDDSESELKILKAYCLYMNESYEKAIEVYSEILPDGLFAERIAPLMAECYIKMKEYQKAYDLLHNMIYNEIPSTDVSVYIHYLHACSMLEKDVETFEILKTAATLFPGNIRMLSLLTHAYLENGEEENAIEIADKLIDILDSIEEENSEDAECLFHAAQYLYLKGDIDRALTYLERAYKINPDMPDICIHLAMAYMLKGDTEKFSYYYKLVPPHELLRYLKSTGMDFDKDKFLDMITNKPILPEQLAQEYLKNKDNSN